MAISLGRESSKLYSPKQMELCLWKIWVGTRLRQPQRRDFAKLASEVGNNLKLLPTFVFPKYARLSSSSSSSSSNLSRKNGFLKLSSSSSSSSSNLPRKNGFLKWYLRKLEAHPIITKGVSSSLIYTSADITSQMMTMPDDGLFDWFRMLRTSFYGLLIMGPSQHYWFSYLSKITIMPQFHMNVTATTLSKILMGQIFFGPCTNTIFFSYNAALRGESGDEIVARLKRDLLPALKNGLMYWPFYDYMTFVFFPVHLQPLANSSFAYFWTIYLTYMASLEKVGSDE